MIDIALRISTYFTDRIASGLQIDYSPQLRGWFEEYRVKAFQHVLQTNIFKKEGTPYSDFRGSLYSAQIRDFSVILAFYDDEILWLDNHTDNNDFELFIQREGLFAWIPERLPDLVKVMTETKFNYLGLPQPINYASDVPPIAEMYRKELPENELTMWEKRLTNITNQIHLPQVSGNREARVSISFCIWTKIRGRIIDLSCFLDGKGKFDYEGKLLAEWTGNFVAPH